MRGVGIGGSKGRTETQSLVPRHQMVTWQRRLKMLRMLTDMLACVTPREMMLYNSCCPHLVPLKLLLDCVVEPDLASSWNLLVASSYVAMLGTSSLLNAEARQ